MSNENGKCDTESSDEHKLNIYLSDRGLSKVPDEHSVIRSSAVPEKLSWHEVCPRSLLGIKPYNQFLPPTKALLATFDTPRFREEGEVSGVPGIGFCESQSPCKTDKSTGSASHMGTGPGELEYPWLYDDATRYIECLDEFQRFSDEWKGIQGWIKEHLVELVEMQDLRSGFQDEAPAGCGQSYSLHDSCHNIYRMLGVGSGSGEVDLAILRALLPRHAHVFTTVVEPDPSQIASYRQLIAGSEFSGQDFYFYQQTSSEFIMENSASNTTFDLIHVIHVLYHIEKQDLEATFSYYYNLLAPGGMLIVTYESDKSSLAKIRQSLQPFKPGMPPYMSIADIEEVLSVVASTCTYERGNIRGILDVTACLQEHPSAKGECLWDFITRVVNFRANAPEEVVRRAADMLREFSWRVDPYNDNGRFLTNTDTAVIVVTKQNGSAK